MTADQLRATISDPRPPDALEPLAAALWWDAKGDWARAHAIAQDVESPQASWVHAYLHRKEGDASNAGYWYGRARKAPAEESLESEWHAIADAVLAGAPAPAAQN